MLIILIIYFGLCLVALYYLHGQNEKEFEFEAWDESEKLYLKYLHECSNEQTKT